MAVGYKEVSEILRIINSSSCDEFVLETADIKLIVRRRGAGGAAASEAPAASRTAPTTPAGTSQSAVSGKPAGQTPQSAAVQASAAGQGALTAPMMGIFYRAPSPDAPPFVEIGSTVNAGDPLCLIEVMKLFTTVYAECSGTVREIGVENAQLVEYGQMLFVIDPA